MNLISLCGVCFDEILMCVMYGEDGLLWFGFDGDEVYVGLSDGFVNCFGIGCIVFVGFDVGFNELWSY